MINSRQKAKLKQYIEEIDQYVIDLRSDMKNKIVHGYDYIEARIRAETLEVVSLDIKEILEMEEI